MMIFQVKRTSNHSPNSDKPPYLGCVRHDFAETLWDGTIEQRAWWSTEINTLEELLKYGDTSEIVLSSSADVPVEDEAFVDGCIELYDGYRE
jgi:hypothetical protein